LGILGGIAVVCAVLLQSTPAVKGANLLANSTFDDGKLAPWETLFLAPATGSAAVVNGELCLQITAGGTNNWEAQARHRDFVVQQGHTYSVSFKAYASQPTSMYAKVGMSGAPYAEYWNQTINLTTTPQTFTGSFTMNAPDDLTVEFAFHMGGALATASLPFTICLDDIVLDDPQYTPQPTPQPIQLPNVRVNQTGYTPNAVKRATIVNAATTPQPWQLRNAAGRIVASGNTRVFGLDAASGDHVHVADFSDYRTPGTGYTLRLGGDYVPAYDVSHPFDISTNIYTTMKQDALHYYYHNRSGIPITMPYAGGEQWTRPAGHVDVPPNKGDKSVPCAPDTGCDYVLDVSGGWYDAGDHGKYVVNGGISVWTLMNQYERAAQRSGMGATFADGTVNIPERGNGVPDILDEARWQMEFMLKMQVPEGQPKAGMVHHKIHDENWTGLPLRPDQDPQPRYLRPPSTAATLNVAATAAQCARIWQTIDPAFAATCLRAGERAWQAALAHPTDYAPASDGNGGGAYNDDDVSDEFYWAAAELFVTTGKATYRDYTTTSPHYLAVPTSCENGNEPGMTWGTTEALGTLSLATVPNQLGNAGIAAARASVVAAANVFVGTIGEQGYRLPFAPGEDGKYPWGSNSFVLNNMIIMAMAYDFTNDVTYLNGVREGMDYILGRNAMDQSYVTGYGENPLKHPHHRFWANQLNPEYPAPPAGAVSGGPNSSLQDPYAQPRLAGCAPQKCFVDHIESWSTNEITINWNAPLTWVTAYLDEHANGAMYLPIVGHTR